MSEEATVYGLGYIRVGDHVAHTPHIQRGGAIENIRHPATGSEVIFESQRDAHEFLRLLAISEETR